LSFSMKNFLHFSHFFHLKCIWKIYSFFRTFMTLLKNFWIFHKITENVINLSDTFSVKNVWKIKEVFHWYFDWKTWIFQPVIVRNKQAEQKYHTYSEWWEAKLPHLPRTRDPQQWYSHAKSKLRLLTRFQKVAVNRR
jgi:hypothetical protein